MCLPTSCGDMRSASAAAENEPESTAFTKTFMLVSLSINNIPFQVMNKLAYLSYLVCSRTVRVPFLFKHLRSVMINFSTQENRQFMQRFVQFINTADVKLASALVSPKATFFVPGRKDPVSGPAGYLEIINMMRSGFPDIQMTLEETIVEGDNIVARYTMRGNHQGAFMGVPPT